MKSTVYTKLNSVLILLLLLFISSSLISQRTLINLISWGEFDVPIGKEDLLDSIFANPLYDSIWPVEVDYLPDFQTNGLLGFTLPAIPGDLFSFAQQVHSFGENNFVWRGKLTNKDGDMMLIEDGDDNVYGYFFVDTSVYELMDLGSHNNILVKYSDVYSDTLIADCTVDGIDLENFNIPTGGINSIRSGCDPEDDTKNIRILVFYTEAALKVNSPGQKAKMFMEQLNMALENSDIAMDEVHFELAGVHELSGFEESSSINEGSLELEFVDEISALEKKKPRTTFSVMIDEDAVGEQYVIDSANILKSYLIMDCISKRSISGEFSIYFTLSKHNNAPKLDPSIPDSFYIEGIFNAKRL